MAKRHKLNAKDWESVFVRLEELVMANSGADSFEEIFKIVIAKLNNFSLDSQREFKISEFNNSLLLASRKWEGIFEGSSPESFLEESHLKVCLEEIDDIDFSNPNLQLFDSLFENLVSRSSKGNKGQFFTPRYVIEACVRILNPQITDSIIDPACGSGGFLIHALLHLQENGSSKEAGNLIWGFDIDAKAIRIARALFLIGGASKRHMYQLNSLDNPKYQQDLFSSDSETKVKATIEDLLKGEMKRHKGFDVILTNPPFAGEVLERELLDSYEISRNAKKVERDVLFIERCIDLLKPGGRIAIVLPHNKLGGKNFADLRQWTMQRLQVVAVIGLGRETFLPHTSQKADILIGVKRERPTKTFSNEEVLFLTSEKSGKNSKGVLLIKEDSSIEDSSWNRVEHDLDEVVDLVRNHANELGLSWGER